MAGSWVKRVTLHTRSWFFRRVKMTTFNWHQSAKWSFTKDVNLIWFWNVWGLYYSFLESCNNSAGHLMLNVNISFPKESFFFPRFFWNKDKMSDIYWWNKRHHGESPWNILCPCPPSWVFANGIYGSNSVAICPVPALSNVLKGSIARFILTYVIGPSEIH